MSTATKTPTAAETLAVLTAQLQALGLTPGLAAQGAKQMAAKAANPKAKIEAFVSESGYRWAGGPGTAQHKIKYSDLDTLINVMETGEPAIWKVDSPRIAAYVAYRVTEGTEEQDAEIVVAPLY
jgi:hypothetical protein